MEKRVKRDVGVDDAYYDRIKKEKQKQKRREAWKDYWASHQGEVTERIKKWRRENKEKYKEQQRRYRRENKEKYRENDRRYYKLHREEILERKRESQRLRSRMRYWKGRDRDRYEAALLDYRTYYERKRAENEKTV